MTSHPVTPEPTPQNGTETLSPSAKRALMHALLCPVYGLGMFILAQVLFGKELRASLLMMGPEGGLGGLMVGFFWIALIPAIPALMHVSLAFDELKANPGMKGSRRTGVALLILGLSTCLNYFIHFIAVLFEGMRGLHGRRFRVQGRVEMAPTTCGSDWLTELRPQVESLDGATQAELARAWLQDAQAEHASIAAFSRLALELMAAGAPPRLLEQTQQAALDEIRHAQACFTLASTYCGKACGPADFPQAVQPARQQVPANRQAWLIVLATDSLVDGCLGEGYAARVAAAALERGTDPAVRRTLAAITAEESRHAQLGWDLLDWCLEQGGLPVHQALTRRLATLELSLPRLQSPTGGNPSILAAHGRLDLATGHRLREAVLDSVRVQAESLLQTWETRTSMAA